MPSAPYPESSYQSQAPLPRRVAGLLLAILANALLVFMLLSLSAWPGILQRENKPITVDLLPEPPPPPMHSRSAGKKAKAGSSAAPRSPAAKAPQAATPRTPAAPVGPLKMLILPRDVFAASDISKLPAHPQESEANGSGSGKAGAEADGGAGGKGVGPNGEDLYDVDWYRRPTNAELAYYLPPGAPREGWAEIMCRMVANYRVEDCRELGDSPAGSGLARAIRQAAWQFRVLPPRVGGRQLLGTWVRIRIDFSQEKRGG